LTQVGSAFAPTIFRRARRPTLHYKSRLDARGQRRCSCLMIY